MKKILALLLCCTLFCLVAASCDKETATEKFFRMYDDMQAISDAEFSFEMSFSAASDDLSSGDAETDETLGMLFSSGGPIEGTITMDGAYSKDSNKMNAEIGLEFGEANGTLTDIICDDGDCYVNVTYFANFVISAFGSLFEGLGVSSDDILQAYDNVLTSDYLLTDGSLDVSDGTMTTMAQGSIDVLRELVTEADPELVSGSNGVYTLSATGDTALDLITAMLEDMQDNAGDYMDEIGSLLGDMEDMGDMGDIGLDEQSMSDQIDDMIDDLESLDEDDLSLTASMEYDRNSKGFLYTMELECGDLFSYSIESTVTPAEYDDPSAPDSYMTTEEFSSLMETMTMSMDYTDDWDTGDTGDTGDAGTTDDGVVDVYYTYGYSTLLNPDLTGYYGLTSYPLYDYYGYAYYVPVPADGYVETDGSSYVDAMFDTVDIYYEVVDGTGYYPDTYMQDWVLYLYDYFDDPSYTDLYISDIYATADNALAMVSTYYYYDGEPYYDIMGVASTWSSDFVYFDFIYIDGETSSDLVGQIDAICFMTGVYN